MPCEVEQHQSMNITKGIIYIYEFDIEDVNILKEGLTIFGVTNVEEATWLKLRREGTKAYILSFNCDQLPETIKIPGEGRSSRVFEYRQRPMQCRRCQQYGHTLKWCRAERAT